MGADEGESWLSRNGWYLIIGAVAVLGGATYLFPDVMGPFWMALVILVFLGGLMF